MNNPIKAFKGLIAAFLMLLIVVTVISSILTTGPVIEPGDPFYPGFMRFIENWTVAVKLLIPTGVGVIFAVLYFFPD